MTHFLFIMINRCIYALILAIMLTSCAKQKYQPAPVSVEETTKKLQDKSRNSAAFHQYLVLQGYPNERIPIKTWGLDELTLSALFHHSALDVAKSKIALAKSDIALASVKQNPVVNTNLGRSNQANGDIRPWTYGINIDIPIETANKRLFRIEEAEHLTEVARMDLAETTWQIRNQLFTDLIAFHQNIHHIALLEKEVTVYERIVKLYQKRLKLGLSSSIEVSKSLLLLQKKQAQLQTEQANTSVILNQIAHDAGLPSTHFKKEEIEPWDLSALMTKQDQKIREAKASALQSDALLNRVDIRRALARYAAAEAKIKLEVAKQTPDITLSPGFLFEFGDKIWSLGFSSLLNLINQHPTFIQQAEQLRAVEGAQFEALQSSIIQRLSQSLVEYDALNQTLKHLIETKNIEQNHFNRHQKQFDAGLIDRLELTQANLNLIEINQQLLQAQFKVFHAQAVIENVLQKPLLNETHYLVEQSSDVSNHAQ